MILVPPPQHNHVIHTTSPTRDADVTDPLCRAEYYRRFSRIPTTFHRSVFILCSQTMCTVTTILFPSTSPFPNPKFLSKEIQQMADRWVCTMQNLRPYSGACHAGGEHHAEGPSSSLWCTLCHPLQVQEAGGLPHTRPHQSEHVSHPCLPIGHPS